jgi:hypothetical protein
VRFALAAIVLALAAAPAYAGGDFMDVTTGGGSVWVSGGLGVVQLDAGTGRVRRQVVLRALYPLSMALGGGAVWVASVENGYVSGTVTRIDAQTGAARTVLHREGWPAEEVAVVGGTVWVGFGGRAASRLARFNLGGRLLCITPLGRDLGWLAADGTGAWVCCHGRRLLRVDSNGRPHASFTLPLANPIWTGLGSLWLDGLMTFDRIDERTGRVLARIPLRSVQDVAFGGGAVYALGLGSVARIDPRTNRVASRRRLRGITQAVAVGTHDVWVAAVLSPSQSERVLRLDPTTLTIRQTIVLD